MSVTVTLILNQVQEIQGPYLRSVDAGSSPAWRFTRDFWSVTTGGCCSRSVSSYR